MTPQEIEQIIDMLVEKLGPTGLHIWSVYIRQVYIQVAMDMFYTVLMTLGAIVSFLAGYKCMKRYQEGPSLNSWDLGALAGFMIGICLILMALIVSNGIAALFNPEYHALQMLLGR